MSKAKSIIEKKSDVNTWSKTDFKAVNIFFKRKGDAKVAKEMAGLKVQYEQWKDRLPLPKEYFTGQNIDVSNNNSNSESDNNIDDVCLPLL